MTRDVQRSRRAQARGFIDFGTSFACTMRGRTFSTPTQPLRCKVFCWANNIIGHAKPPINKAKWHASQRLCILTPKRVSVLRDPSKDSAQSMITPTKANSNVRAILSRLLQVLCVILCGNLWDSVSGILWEHSAEFFVMDTLGYTLGGGGYFWRCPAGLSAGFFGGGHSRLLGGTLCRVL